MRLIKFFYSLTALILLLLSVLGATAQKDWSVYEDEVGAFSVKVPVTPIKNGREVIEVVEGEEVTFNIQMYISTDLVNQVNYIMAYHDFPLGYFLEDKETGFQETLEEIRQLHKVISKPDTIFHQGFEGRKIEFLIEDKFYCELRFYIRGNRVYKQIKQYLRKSSVRTESDLFFESLHFSPFNHPDFIDLNPENESFSLKVFEEYKEVYEPVLDDQSYIDDVHTIYSVNPNSGGVFSLEYGKLGKYFNVLNVDTFYTNYLQAVKMWSDSVISNDSTSIDGVYGREVVLFNPYNENYSRIKFWIDGKYTYHMAGALGKEELYNSASNMFFSSISNPSGIDSLGFIYSSKSTELLNNLNSDDSLEFAMAKGALSYYEFEKSDIKSLVKRIQLPHDDDTLYSGIRTQLISSIAYLDPNEMYKSFPAVYLNENTSCLLYTSDAADE